MTASQKTTHPDQVTSDVDTSSKSNSDLTPDAVIPDDNATQATP